MSKKARDRLNQSATFEVLASPMVPREDLTYTEAWEKDEVCEAVWDDGQSRLVCCAPHSGDIETNTAQAATIVRKRLGADHASAWFVSAFGQNAFDRWHVTTNNMSPKSYPGLYSIANRGFEHAVSFHVWNGEEVLVGGLSPRSFRDSLGEEIQRAINDELPVITDRSDGKYMAETENNLVNWLTVDDSSGVQIEMPPRIARNYSKRLARAVAEFYEDIL
jgi:phage replication-related protein YjqB (UPF0714/DUF867 family)